MHPLRYFSLLAAISALLFSGCNTPPSPQQESNPPDTMILSVDSIFNAVQVHTFQYFWHGAESNSGLAWERYDVDGVCPENDMNMVTSGGSGFGMMAILSGM
jgi:hypothetical protein